MIEPKSWFALLWTSKPTTDELSLLPEGTAATVEALAVVPFAPYPIVSPTIPVTASGPMNIVTGILDLPVALAAAPGPAAATALIRTTADRIIGIIAGTEDRAARHEHLQTIVDEPVDTEQRRSACA